MDHFNYRQQQLFAEDVSLSTLAEEVGTPFYCYSTATLVRHYQVFAEGFAGLNAKICFAVKSNCNLAVIRTLGQQGAGADVVSEGEIRMALAAGIKPQDIVFSGVGKTQDEMAYALDQNIFQFNVESEEELRELSKIAAAKGITARIALRVNPDVTPKTHAKISTGQKETKFGIAIVHAQAMYKLAASLPGIAAKSVSVHIGSQITSLAPMEEAFKRVVQLVKTLRAEGHDITTLDLGGGLGIPYGHTDPPPLPAEYAKMVRRVVGDLDCQLVFEPGRLMVGNAGIMVTKVIYVKRTDSRIFVVVDAGMNDLIRPTLYEAYHEIVPVKVDETAATELVDIVGPVCETGDIFAEQRLLRVPQAGDLLAFRTAGAYGAVMAGTYNSRPLVPEVMVNGGEFAVTRVRPTYEDMLAQYTLPEWLK